MSAPKVVEKGMPQKKTYGKDNRPPKKTSVTFGEKQPTNWQRLGDVVRPRHLGNPSPSYTHRIHRQYG